MSTQQIALPTRKEGIRAEPITGAKFFQMHLVGPAELVAGEIQTKMPTGHLHGFIESLIAFFLNLYMRDNPKGRVLTGEVGIYTKRNPDSIRAADIVFVSHERMAQAQPEGFLDVAPELIVEIMSPANTWTEAQEKLAEYFAIGVNTVWIVDPQLEQIHVYHSLEKVVLLRKEDTLTGESSLPGFRLALVDIFDAK